MEHTPRNLTRKVVESYLFTEKTWLRHSTCRAMWPWAFSFSQNVKTSQCSVFTTCMYSKWRIMHALLSILFFHSETVAYCWTNRFVLARRTRSQVCFLLQFELIFRRSHIFCWCEDVKSKVQAIARIPDEMRHWWTTVTSGMKRTPLRNYASQIPTCCVIKSGR